MKKKWSLKKKLIVIFSSLFVAGVSVLLFLFYGPWDGFRNFWITSAMNYYESSIFSNLVI